MPPSQLKRLKTSLREQGVVGPQKSKKQKKQASKSGALRDTRIQKNAALQGIREQFNPFEVRAPQREKYEVVSNRVPGGRLGKGAVSRPGVTKGLGEENRRRTLLVEMQRRKKIGGIMDRRFGENDPTMTPEEKALERFVREKQKRSRKGDIFDLEDAEEGNGLTHFGESLSFNKTSAAEDFNEADLDSSVEERSNGFLEERPHKRRRLSESTGPSDGSQDEEMGVGSEQPKTRKEVMEEVIAKSKLHKYERQKAKEDDDDLRAELDRGLPDLFALMRGTLGQSAPAAPRISNDSMNPDRLALLNGKDRSQADKEYDERLRQMAMDQRAKPTVRTLTEEEKLQQDAQRLKELEEKRIQRMRGEQNGSEADSPNSIPILNGEEHQNHEEMDAFGLGSGLGGQNQLPSQVRELGVEDEDDFIIEDNLIASGSEIDASEDQQPEGSSAEVDEGEDDDDQEFIKDILSETHVAREDLMTSTEWSGIPEPDLAANNLAYTYDCPVSHEDLLKIAATTASQDLPTVVQRIRALYHPKLAAENKTKLAKFATVLVAHIHYMASQSGHPPFSVIEALIRHIHSLAKTFPEDVGSAFRSHLESLHVKRHTTPVPGDLIILTAISSIFPTSDHFHQVVTPAMLSMTRYLSQRIPSSLADLTVGTYLCTLCLQYQRLSKRYVPEVVNYILNALLGLAPAKIKRVLGSFPNHDLWEAFHVEDISEIPSEDGQLDFWQVLPHSTDEPANQDQLKHALLNAHIVLVENMVELWAEKSAFCEVFDPIYSALKFLSSKPCLNKLSDKTKADLQAASSKIKSHLHNSFAARKSLRLHNHRPLAIKTSIPKFEESYNPDKHYDPDRDRAELSKLKAEHKRERKGALRELRKDANFIARESLREKKEKDSAYEKKYRRLVAEIQGEEGREAKEYEREKRLRKGKR